MGGKVKLANGLSLAYSRGLTAINLREPNWVWRPQPLKAMVLRHGTEAIAVARTFPRTIQTVDVAIPVMGIGGVYVDRELRRNGFGRLVIAATCQRLRDDGMIAACLFANETYKWLYKNLGFIEVQPGFMIKPLNDGLTFTESNSSFPQDSPPWSLEPDGHF